MDCLSYVASEIFVDMDSQELENGRGARIIMVKKVFVIAERIATNIKNYLWHRRWSDRAAVRSSINRSW